MQLKLYTVFLLVSFSVSVYAYRIECNFFQLNEREVKLARYEGKKLFEVETATTDKNGILILEGEENLPCGLYVFVLPQGISFELLMPENNQEFQVFAEYPEIQQTLLVKGNPVVSQFVAYQKSFIEVSNKQKDVRKRLLSSFQNPDSLRMLRTENDQLDSLRKEIEDKYIEQNQHNILGDYIYWSKRLQNPLFHASHSDTVLHHLRQLTIPGECLVHSPLFEVFMDNFHNTIKKLYFKDQQKGVDILLSKLSADDRRYKFVLSNLYNRYNNPNNAEMEAIFFHLMQNYYLTDHVDWISESLRTELQQLVSDEYLTVLGSTFPELPRNIEKSLPDFRKSGSQKTWLLFVENDCQSCFDLLKKLENEFINKGNYSVYVFDLGDKITTNRLSGFPDNWHISNHYAIADEITELLKISRVPQVYVLDEAQTILAKGNTYKGTEHLLKKEPGQ